ncbi:hypothetical protein ILUMI_03312 [Ignelater luminosus]|uniref:Uncharacterized protein n=1 Tax=Ignelater luminosus TaxID=2038154 RepID=A0A8K0DB12_IGNLU|nr:hypothetical protein ILUMI_03312 [Ignelater luminosus]
MESQESLVGKHTFEDKPFEVIEKSSGNNFTTVLTVDQYSNILNEVKDSTKKKDAEEKLICQDYGRLNKFEIIKIGENEKIIANSNFKRVLVKISNESDECGTELLNKDNANNATNEKTLQHNFSIDQPENHNLEEELLRNNETRLTSINQHRPKSIRSLKKQAAEMLQQNCSKYSKVEIEQNVLVKIPDVDRGRLPPHNILAVGLSEREDLYQFGTSPGVLEKLYARNEFQPSQTNTLASSYVPIDKKFSLPTVAAKESNSAQGFLKCNCRKQCGDKKCNLTFRDTFKLSSFKLS